MDSSAKSKFYEETPEKFTHVPYTEHGEMTSGVSYTEHPEKMSFSDVAEVSPPQNDKPSRDNHNHDEDITLQNNVSIGGVLRAKEIVHPWGAVFRSFEALVEEFPSPDPGMWAFTGAQYPFDLYCCRELGKWELVKAQSFEYQIKEYLRKNGYATEDWVLAQGFGSGSGSGGPTPGELSKLFLSKIYDDIAKGKITFEQGLESLAKAIFHDGAEFGEFIDSLFAGKGAGVDKDGNAQFESVEVRGYFRAMEYIVNRLSTLEGDQLLTEGDTIERVVDNGDGTYDLYLQSKWDGYFTAQVENNVLKGIFNTLAEGSGSYYTSWVRVNSVNPTLNMLNVTLYPDEEVPAGRNFAPCEMMKIARWGNQTDRTRQSCLYLSSSEGRIVRLVDVTKPIIDKSNYGATFGTVPDFIRSITSVPVGDDDSCVYAKHFFGESFTTVDYQGRPLPTFVDRGPWDVTADYYCGEINPATGVYETSDVWYMGCRYRCMRSGTHSAPAWNCTDWAMLEGNPEFTVEFAPVNTVWTVHNIDMELRIVARLHNQDVTGDVLDQDIVWERYSEDAEGNVRALSDSAWTMAHAGAGKMVHITVADIDYNGRLPNVVRFTATVTLRDNIAIAALTIGG